MRTAFFCLLSALALVPVAARADVRAHALVLMPDDPAARKFADDWGFSDAIVVGDTIYLSGVVAGLHEGETSLEPAYTRAFERIGAILRHAGASWDDVVEMTTFHTDLTTQMPAIVA